MSPLSLDLRHRIIQAWQKEKAGVPELAERFSVATATVKRLIRRFRDTGSVEPLLHGGGQRPKIPAEKLDLGSWSRRTPIGASRSSPRRTTARRARTFRARRWIEPCAG